MCVISRIEAAILSNECRAATYVVTHVVPSFIYVDNNNIYINNNNVLYLNNNNVL